MGTEGHMRQGSDDAVKPVDGRPIVAFDFDGTLSIRDSFMAFLEWRVDQARFVSGLLRLAPAALRYAINRDRGEMKRAAAKEFLAGLDKATLEAEAERFAAEVWPKFMRPDALATWERWGREGAWRVIVTASPETTIAPFARRLGADDLIGTQLSFDSAGGVTGGFDTPNCRAAEKVTRLKAHYGDGVALKAAYGDSTGDTEMVAMAEVKGMKVFTGRPG